ncbi:MAG TPA: hypothetical protein VE821_08900 [Pyrinomonadaceae bacterium]|nr:hypothetical protein [Pyrinomonadaceae bacterium]
MARERHLEDLLFSHPYLLDPEFAGLTPRRQQTGAQARLDLSFQLPGGLCIVELKKTRLTRADLNQLLRYCRLWTQQGARLATHHYLIGSRPRNEASLRQAAVQSGFEIRLRYLGEHVPLRLVWHAGARRYFPLDDTAAADNYLELRL